MQCIMYLLARWQHLSIQVRHARAPSNESTLYAILAIWVWRCTHCASFRTQQFLLPAPRRLCFCLCVFVSRITQKVVTNFDEMFEGAWCVTGNVIFCCITTGIGLLLSLCRVYCMQLHRSRHYVSHLPTRWWYIIWRQVSLVVPWYCYCTIKFADLKCLILSLITVL